MPNRLPTPQITWRFRANLSTSEDSDQEHRARMVFELKQSLVNLATGWTDSSGASSVLSGTWAVVASSDGVAADATDRWAAIDDLVWETNGTAHSWIVLRYVDYFGSGNNLEMLIDCSQSSAAQRHAAIGVYISTSAFNVGTPSILNRPTATEEVAILAADGSVSTSPWQGPATNDENHRVGRLHIMASTDLRYFRWFVYRGSACVGRGDLFPLDDYYSTSDWHMPCLFQIWSIGTDVECNTWALHRSDADSAYVGRDRTAGNFTARAQCLTATSSDTASVDSAANTFTGGYGFSPIGLDAEGVAAGAPFAAIPDQWWGNASQRAASWPADGSNQFVQLGDMITQWNRSTLLTS